MMRRTSHFRVMKKKHFEIFGDFLFSISSAGISRNFSCQSKPVWFGFFHSLRKKTLKAGVQTLESRNEIDRGKNEDMVKRLF